MFLLALYKIITNILTPLIKLNLKIRLWRGKEDPKRIEERFSNPSLKKPEGFLLWIHASSTGEVISILNLIKRINEKYPEMNILLTTMTVASANIIENKLPKNVFHQYLPIDIEKFIKKFLNYWTPNLTIITESELWPNLIYETKKYCPMILINGRISNKSYKRWRYLYHLSSALFNNFSIVFAQSREDSLKFKELGSKNVQNLGNIKYSSPPLAYNPKEMSKIVSMTAQRHIWVAASTHKGEEEIIATVHIELKNKFPDLLTIIIPRHIKRANNIVKELSIKNLSIIKRSENKKINSDLDIYIADTTEELGIFYRVSNIVLIGGSLLKGVGGHNLIEAAKLNCAIIYGQDMTNFKEICEEFEDNKAAIKVNDTYQLIKNLEDLLKDKGKQEKLSNAALKITENKEKIIENTLEKIIPFLEKYN